MNGPSARGAAGAQPVQREVREAHVVAELGADQLPSGIELPRLGLGDAAALLADQVLVLALTDERVQPRAVAEMDVADDAELFEALEGAVDGRELDRRAADLAARDLLGRDQTVGREQRPQHEAARRREPAAVAPDHRLDVLEALETKRLATWSDRHSQQILCPTANATGSH